MLILAIALAYPPSTPHDPAMDAVAQQAVSVAKIPGAWVGIATRTGLRIGSAGLADLEMKTPAGTDDVLPWASISKPITAVVAGTAMIENNIPLSTMPFSEFPEFTGVCAEPYKSITLEDLFLHRHNLPRDYRGQKLKGKDLTALRRDRIADLIQQPDRPNPDRTSQYSNAGYVAIAYTIEKKTGQNWDDLWKDVLHKRFGLLSFGMGTAPQEESMPIAYRLEPSSFAAVPRNYRDQWRWQPSGGFHSTLGDLLKFAQTYSKSAMGEGGPLAPEVTQLLTREGAGRTLGWAQSKWKTTHNWSHNGSLGTETCELHLIPERGWAYAYYFNSGRSKAQIANEGVWNALLSLEGIRTQKTCDVRLTDAYTLSKDWKTRSIPDPKDEVLRFQLKLHISGATVRDFKADVTVDGITGSAVWLDTMAPGNHILNLSLPNPGAGTHQVQVTLDPLGLVNDSDRRNNVASFPLQIG